MFLEKLVSQNKIRILTLYATSMLGVAIGILVSVLNTRSLPPDLYGDVRYVNNIISFIAGLLLFGFFTSGSRLLAVSDNPKEARGLRGCLVLIFGGTIVVTMLLMFLLYFWHSTDSNKEQLATLFLWAIPICGSYSALNYINTVLQGDNNIIGISIMRFLPGLLYFVVAFGLYNFFSATPVLMLLLQNGFTLLVGFFIILKTRPSFSNIKYYFSILSKENKKYGLDVYYGSVAGVSMSYLAGITLGAFSDNNIDVGFYSLALTIATPLTMLPGIIGTNYYKEFARIDSISKKIFINTLIITVISYVLYVIIIFPVVDFLYDENYKSVSYYAVFIAIGTTVHGVGDMINRFLSAHGKGTYLRNGAFVCGFILLTGNIALVFIWGIKGAILTKILASLGYLISMIFYYRKSCKK